MEMKPIQKLLIKLFDNNFTLPTRNRENVYQRAVYYKLCRDFTRYSTIDIGNSINRNHATVLHGLKLFMCLITWKEDKYLDVYKEARIKLTDKLNKNKSWRNKTYKQKYQQLLFKHILLKEKHAKLKTRLEKIT
jgi:hypothetical protein